MFVIDCVSSFYFIEMKKIKNVIVLIVIEKKNPLNFFSIKAKLNSHFLFGSDFFTFHSLNNNNKRFKMIRNILHARFGLI